MADRAGISMGIASWWKKQVDEYRHNKVEMLERDAGMLRRRLECYEHPEYARFTSEENFKRYLRRELSNCMTELRKASMLMRRDEVEAARPSYKLVADKGHALMPGKPSVIKAINT